MVSIYDFKDYREYILAFNNHLPSGKKGFQRKLATACGVSPTLISLILKGEKHLNLEQASDLSDLFELTPKEAEYFFLLVEYGRAGTVRLKNRLEKQISDSVLKLSRRVDGEDLPDSLKGIFYSSWVYAAIRNLSALENFNSSAEIAQRLQLPKLVVEEAMDFLIENKLCIQRTEKLTYGPQNTYVSSDSPMVLQHHRNWRGRAFQEMEMRKETNLFYTCPMSLSREVAQEVRHILPKVIEDIQKRVGPSDSEVVYCLNLDWYEF